MKIEEIKDYLKIDDDQDDNFLNELIEISRIYIDSMVGESYKKDENAIKLAHLLQKKLIADMYEDRRTELSNTKQNRIVISILEKLSNY